MAGKKKDQIDGHLYLQLNQMQEKWENIYLYIFCVLKMSGFVNCAVNM